MKLIVAKEIGYCYGVKDAIEEVIRVSKKVESEVNTFGPLIHNPKAVEELKEKHNISAISDITEMKGNTLAIRAHGISPKVYDSFVEKGIKIIDTTCPFVKKTQEIARQLVKEGYFVIILGKKKHPEVVGIAGHVEDNCLIVEKEEDLDVLNKTKKIGIVFQSTITVGDVDELIPKIIERAKEIKIHKTICGVTIRRQSQAREIAKQVDLMLVIGGKNSSNTTKLAHICEKEGVTTIQIEYPHEIKELNFDSINSIGVTTGTSTPQNVIDNILEEIKTKAEDIELISVG